MSKKGKAAKYSSIRFMNLLCDSHKGSIKRHKGFWRRDFFVTRISDTRCEIAYLDTSDFHDDYLAWAPRFIAIIKENKVMRLWPKINIHDFKYHLIYLVLMALILSLTEGNVNSALFFLPLLIISIQILSGIFVYFRIRQFLRRKSK